MLAPAGLYRANTATAPTFGWGRTPRKLPVERPAFSPVSDTFHAEVEKARDALPLKIQTRLAREGYAVKTCRRATDVVADPDKARTMAFCYSRGPKDIYLAEEYLDVSINRQRAVVAAQREDTLLPPGEPLLGLVLKHETGHIMDRMLGNISEYAAYKNCLKQDRERLAKNGVPDDTFVYLCGHHNRQDSEVIAEILTELTTGAPSMLSAGHHKQLGTPLPMATTYPQTARWVKNRLRHSRLKGLMAQ